MKTITFVSHYNKQEMNVRLSNDKAEVLASIKSMSTADIEKKMADLAIVFKVYRDNGWKHDTSYQGAANIYARCIDELNNRDNK